MHYIDNMVLLQILTRSFTLIILVSLIIPEYGYSKDIQEMNELVSYVKTYKYKILFLIYFFFYMY